MNTVNNHRKAFQKLQKSSMGGPEGSENFAEA